jgi:hypothetical protein
MAVMPVAVMPTVAPVTVPTVMPVTVMMPVYFFRLDVVDVVLRYDSGFCADGRGSGLQRCRYRRKWCGLCACGKRCAACHKSDREF